MAPSNESGSDGRKPPYIENQSYRRDDTPSFIREVHARATAMNVGERRDSLPVLEMPATVRLWRKLKWPLFIFGVVTLLVIIGAMTYDTLLEKRVVRTIRQAREAEAAGTLERIKTASDRLSILADRYQDRSSAQVAWAWNAYMQAELFGPENELLGAAREALERADGYEDAHSAAVAAALLGRDGDVDGALAMVARGRDEFGEDPRLAMVEFWTLERAGKREQAFELLERAASVAPDYVPLKIAGIVSALHRMEQVQALKLAMLLEQNVTGHLVTRLAKVASRLPGWDEQELSTKEIATMLQEVRRLQKKVEQAPPKLLALGRYLSGRIYLLGYDYTKAHEHLRFASSQPAAPVDAFTWYALSVKETQGAQKLLALLDSRKDYTTTETMELKVASLLEQYRPVDAQAVIDEWTSRFKTTRAADRLLWTRAVLNGDYDVAVASLPKVILPSERWVAIDLYEAISKKGDTRALDQLTRALEDRLSLCAEAINVWHSPRTRRALYLFGDPGGKKGPCVDGLTARVFFRHAEPSVIKAATERAVKASSGNVRVEVDHARAVWLADGRDAAEKILAAVEKKGPQGEPTLTAIGNAYFEMGLNSKAESVLAELKNGEALALKIRLARIGKDRARENQLRKQSEAEGTRRHPALVLIDLEDRFAREGYAEVAEDAADRFGSAGYWGAEILELAAKSLNSMGEKSDADRLIGKAIRKLRERSGLAEAWEGTLASVRLLMRRGGSHADKARNICGRFYTRHIKDPRFTYSAAVLAVRDGNEKSARKNLERTVKLDPSFAQAYKRMKAMGILDDEQRAHMKKVLPDLTL